MTERYLSNAVTKDGVIGTTLKSSKSLEHRCYDDAAWETGDAPLGYGVDGIATTISFGEDAENKHPAAYFRLIFNVNRKKTCDDCTNATLVFELQLTGGIRFDIQTDVPQS